MRARAWGGWPRICTHASSRCSVCRGSSISNCTVKPLYGHQQGAQIGYNPHKAGRPSHCYHSYFMANTRLCLGVEVCGGKDHAAMHGLPELWKLLDALPRTRWPSCLRGDCAYGNQALLSAAEELGLPYPCKLRHTNKVKTLLRQIQRAGASLSGPVQNKSGIDENGRVKAWDGRLGGRRRRDRPTLGVFAPSLWGRGAACGDKMKQLFHRLPPEFVRRILSMFNDGHLDAGSAAGQLGIAKTRLYELRFAWLSRRDESPRRCPPGHRAGQRQRFCRAVCGSGHAPQLSNRGR